MNRNYNVKPLNMATKKTKKIAKPVKKKAVKKASANKTTKAKKTTKNWDEPKAKVGKITLKGKKTYLMATILPPKATPTRKHKAKQVVNAPLTGN